MRIHGKGETAVLESICNRRHLYIGMAAETMTDERKISLESNYTHVFSPITIRGVEFKNRLEMAPSSPGLTDKDGYMTVDCVNFFRPIAMGGVGVLTLGNSPVDWAESRDEERHLRMDIDDVILPLTRFTDMCHQFQCEPSIELNHSGMDAVYEYTTKPMVSASETVTPLELKRAAANGRKAVRAQEMSYEKVKETIQKYIDAAVRSQKAGFRRVMVHGGHGNLIAQFSSPYYNRRQDEYGGSLEKRARFAMEILEGIRKACGEDLVIEFRVSAEEVVEGGMTFEETKKYLKLLGDRIDIVNVSRGLHGDPEYMRYWMNPYSEPHMSNVEYAREIRAMLPSHIKVAAVAGIMNLDNAENLLAQGYADIICLARPFFADPEMPRKYAMGKADTVRPCLRCGHCTTRLMAHFTTHCAVNPLLGRQSEFVLGKVPPAEEKKRVAVIGGGPAGLQAADTLLQRGHEVTVYEQSGRLGGTLHDAVGTQPLKQDLKAYLDYIIHRAETSGANILLNTAATREMLEAERYDAVIIACGATPRVPQVPGVELPHVHWAPEGDSGKISVGNQVVIIGSGVVGLESAYGLARKGRTITVVECKKDLCLARGGVNGGLGGAYLPITEKILADGTIIKLNSALAAISETEVSVVNGDTLKVEKIPADTVLLATGMEPRRAVVEKLRTCAPATEVWVVGDAKRPANVAHAVHSGFDATCYL